MPHLTQWMSIVHCMLLAASASGSWTVEERQGSPGKRLDVREDGKLVAQFIYGEGQIKPYLHLFAEQGYPITNSGLDASGRTNGHSPHHRGIFIGWNRIVSDLGSEDLWHMTKGTQMRVQKIEKLEGQAEHAGIVASITWHSGKEGNDILLRESRGLKISRAKTGGTMVDAKFDLEAARDLTLGGDLQHAGIHFRAENEVDHRTNETAYVWEPDLPGPGGKVASKELKWCRFLFPIKDTWRQAIIYNAPRNPVEELSWRDYGRFGFFFKQGLRQGQSVTLRYRFFVEEAGPPKKPGRLSPEEKAKAQEFCHRGYEEFAQALAKEEKFP